MNTTSSLQTYGCATLEIHSDRILFSSRAVMLEQPRKSGAKVISHMLAAHGGEIFIHALPSSRSLLEDPPSISEGAGGRVTDYRITNFGEFMKEHRLAPSRPEARGKGSYATAISRLERGSRFWPMVISDTLLLNIQDEAISPLASLLAQPAMTEGDVREAKKAVLRVTAMEAKNEPLPIPAQGARGKGPKREEQYRLLWKELEELTTAHAPASARHREVLECVLDCRKPPEEGGGGGGGGKKRGAEVKVEVKQEPGLSETEQSWQDLERIQKKTELLQGDKVAAAAEPPAKKLKANEELLMRSGGQTLLSMWNNRLRAIQAKRTRDFDGRSDGGKLYIQLDEPQEIKQEGPAVQVAAGGRK